MSPVIVFRLNHLKGTAEALAVDLSRLNILRGTKTALLTPERYDEHPRPYICQSVPGGHLLIGQSVGQPASLSFR